jgi:hypothetical protein
MKMNGCKTKCEDCPDYVPPAQPAPVQEPVAWMSASQFEELQKGFAVMTTLTKQRAFEDDVAIYTTPLAAQREWVGLTDEDLANCSGHEVRWALYWEKLLKGKNT